MGSIFLVLVQQGIGLHLAPCQASVFPIYADIEIVFLSVADLTGMQDPLVRCQIAVRCHRHRVGALLQMLSGRRTVL